MGSARSEGTLSQPPVRRRADGEAALAGLLRIGSGLGARVVGSRSLREGVLAGVLLGVAAVLAVVTLGALR